MNRHAYSIFCDDIRFEQGGKTSFMGIYNSDLIVPHNPFVIPKLSIITSVVTPIERPFLDLTVQVLQNGVVIQEQIMPDNAGVALAEQIVANNQSDEPYIAYSIGVFIALTSFVIGSNSTLKVIARSEGEEINAGRLNVRVAKHGERPPGL